MSKKNKRKFQQRRPEYRPTGSSEFVSTSTNTMSQTSSTMSSSSVVEFSSPAVTGKPSSFSAPVRPASSGLSDAHAEEYRVIKNDLIKVVILNAVFLAGVLALYYTNLSSGYLERWFSSVLKF